ncbi:hypothetical protein ACJX0J_039507, partial [Zea mays]
MIAVQYSIPNLSSSMEFVNSWLKTANVVIFMLGIWGIAILMAMGQGLRSEVMTIWLIIQRNISLNLLMMLLDIMMHLISDTGDSGLPKCIVLNRDRKKPKLGQKLAAYIFLSFSDDFIVYLSILTNGTLEICYLLVGLNLWLRDLPKRKVDHNHDLFIHQMDTGDFDIVLAGVILNIKM